MFFCSQRCFFFPELTEEKTVVKLFWVKHTDGKNPVDIVKIPWLLQGFSSIQTVVGLGISKPSTVSFAKLTN